MVRGINKILVVTKLAISNDILDIINIIYDAQTQQTEISVGTGGVNSQVWI